MTEKEQSGERLEKTFGILTLSALFLSVLFSFFEMTGFAFVEKSIPYYDSLGVGLLIVGLIFGFFFFRKRKKIGKKNIRK